MTEQEYLDMYEVVGVAFDVYNELGRGMAEPIYQEALAIEFNLRGMKAIREKKLSLSYKGIPIERIAKKERGLLFNYGEKNLHTERYLYIPEDDEFVLLNKNNLKLYIQERN